MPRIGSLGMFKQRGRGRDDSDPGPTPLPTYVATASALTVNEGASVTITLTTTDVPNNTIFYWSYYNSQATAADFGNTPSGSVVIQNNVATLTLTATADGLTEGPELFYIAFREGSAVGRILTVSPGVTIVDTSPAATYAVTPTANSVNEGAAVTFNVTTTGVANGTTLYWAVWTPLVYRLPASVNDFVAINGTVTITNNAGSFTVTPRADNLTEGGADPDMFHIQITTIGFSGSIVATSNGVAINDTSRTPPPPVSATMTLVDSSSATYSVLSSPMGAGIQDGRNVFNMGTTAANLRHIAFMDLRIVNAPQLVPTGQNKLLSTLGWLVYRQNINQSVVFVPSNKDFVHRTGFFTRVDAAFLYACCMSYASGVGVYRIWEYTGYPPAPNLLDGGVAAGIVRPLYVRNPIWMHHPKTNTNNFLSADFAAWHTILIPQIDLKFIWRVKATNQA